MAIAFDANSNVSITASASSHTLAHTCTGTDRILLVGITSFDSPYDVVTGVTYNGVSMTLIDKQFRASNRGVYLYVLVNPASGTNNVVISLSGIKRVGIDATSFTGAEQTSQPEASGKQETNSITKTMTLSVVTDQSILVASIFTNESDTGGANTTITGGTINNVFAYSTSPVGTGSQSLITTQGSTVWSQMVYAVIKPAVAASTFIPRVTIY